MAIAAASDFNAFLVGMAIAGLGFGVYVAVDLALVADVLPDAVPAPPRTSASSTWPAPCRSRWRRRSRRSS